MMVAYCHRHFMYESTGVNATCHVISMLLSGIGKVLRWNLDSEIESRYIEQERTKQWRHYPSLHYTVLLPFPKTASS
jgi:hypothetical protein